MKCGFSLVLMATILAGATCANAQTTDVKGKVCHLEQQCHWENFKKICTWVKVCR